MAHMDPMMDLVDPMDDLGGHTSIDIMYTHLEDGKLGPTLGTSTSGSLILMHRDGPRGPHA